jgi:hypothetical protein
MVEPVGDARVEPAGELHLWRKPEVGVAPDDVLDVEDQVSYLPRRSTASVHDEIGVEPGNFRIAYAVALQSGLLDETPGRVAWRIRKDRPQTVP